MININGELLDPKQAKIAVSNRGFAYGDAVFETIRVIHGKIIFWEDHYFRLMASMRIMRMEIPIKFSPEFLQEEILALVKIKDQEKEPVRIRLTVFRDEGGFYAPESKGIGYTITSELLEGPFYLFSQEKYEVELFKDHYVNSGLLSTLKTNNRAINVLGSIFAQENGYQNCLLLNENKNVVEALNGNLFVVKGDTIKTPPLTDGCVKGVIRGKLLEMGKQLKVQQIIEETVSPFELQKADELFITNVVRGIQPITKYRKKEYNVEVGKDLLSKLNLKARLD